jgi:hypothetical protein
VSVYESSHSIGSLLGLSFHPEDGVEMSDILRTTRLEKAEYLISELQIFPTMDKVKAKFPLYLNN